MAVLICIISGFWALLPGCLFLKLLDCIVGTSSWASVLQSALITKTSWLRLKLIVTSINIEGLSVLKEEFLYQVCKSHDCSILCIKHISLNSPVMPPNINYDICNWETSSGMPEANPIDKISYPSGIAPSDKQREVDLLFKYASTLLLPSCTSQIKIQETFSEHLEGSAENAGL